MKDDTKCEIEYGPRDYGTNYGMIIINCVFLAGYLSVFISRIFM